MILTIKDRALRNFSLLLVAISVSAVSSAQHKQSAPAPRQSAPAPHASAPARSQAPTHSAGPSQHTNAPAHNNMQNRTMTGANGHNNTGASSRTTGNTMNRPNGTANGHVNNAANTRNGGSMNGRPGANSAGKTVGNNGRSGATNGKPGGAGAANAHAGNANARGGAGATRGGMNHTPPGRQVSLKGGGSAHIRPNGQIRSVNRNGMQIQHNLHGGRTIVANHNGARVVTMGRHGGYVQRAYVTRGGHSYYSRTYYSHGEYHTAVYQSYYYGGRPYYGYYPSYYYSPVYYGWAYNPWPAPVYYGWGWGGAPWYGYYGAYFTPYPVYPSAAFWLTDYLIAANLQAAYAASVEVGKVGPAASDQLVASMGPIPAPENKAVALTPELKTAIAEEIKAELAAEKSEASKKSSASDQSAGGSSSQEAPPALDPARRIFIVATDLSVVADGDECELTAGDVITRLTDKPDDDNNVNVSVSASKKTDCAAGKQVAVGVDDLQEMHNHFREQITSGMGDLAKKQGKDGLPKAPDTSTVQGDVPPPPPDKSAAKTLEEQEKNADQTEADVKQEASSDGGGSQ